MNIKILVKAIIGTLIICLAGNTQAQLRTGTGVVKELYDTNCAACHGADMNGGLGSSLIDDEWAHGSSDEDIARVIREGIPDTTMIPWGNVLSDNQIRSLVIYIHEQKLLASQTGTVARTAPEDGIFKTAAQDFKLEKVGEGSAALWSMTFLPDGAVLATQIDGKLWRFKDGKRTEIKGTPKVWNDFQAGLLDVQLHPDYRNNGWIYLSFSEDFGKNAEGKSTGTTTLVRGKIRNNRWTSQETIFRAAPELVSQLTKNYHFGSRFAFKDGYLFFGIGDRGEQDDAQNLALPQGKIHRIHDDGRIPADNPFVNQENAYPTIWSYGNRNAQGLAFHPVTGELWETEHGPRGGDELNLIEKGKNYGWPVITYGMNYDGTPITDKTHQEGMEQPRHYWTPSIAISTLAFYSGDKFPAWNNNLFVAGMASEQLHRLELDGHKVSAEEIVMRGQGRIRHVAAAPDGHLYVILNSGNPRTGTLYRLVPAN